MEIIRVHTVGLPTRTSSGGSVLPSQKECLPMTGFRRRTDALVHTVLVNAGLVPIPLFINAPDPQGAFAATLPLVKYVEFIIQGGRGNCNPRL